MGSTVLGGGQRTDFFTVTNSTSPSCGTVAVYSLTDQVSTDVKYDGSGVPTVTVVHTQDDSTYQDFLDTYQDQTASSNTEEITYESGTKLTGSSSSKILLQVVKGGLSGAEQKVWFGIVSVSNESGSWTQEADKYGKPSLILNGVAVKGTLAVPSAVFTNFMVTPATQTISTTVRKYGKVIYG